MAELKDSLKGPEKKPQALLLQIKDDSNKFSSKTIVDELVTLISEDPSSEDKFDRKSKPIFHHLIKFQKRKKNN